MKTLTAICAFLLLNSLSVYATENNIEIDADDIEITHESNVDEETKLTIKDVKNIIEATGAKNTCMDEYLKRRKQLIGKLILTPATAVAAGAASVYIGGAAGAGVAVATNVRGWGALGYIILGAGGGLITTSTYVLYDTTKSGFEIVDNNLILKALAEQYSNIDGPKSEKLYKKYLKKSHLRTLTKADFFDNLLELDKDGSLCNGSMTKKPLVKLGFDLKYKLVNSKNLIKKI